MLNQTKRCSSLHKEQRRRPRREENLTTPQINVRKMPTQEQMHKHLFKDSWVCMYAEDTVQDIRCIDQPHLRASDHQKKRLRLHII